MIDQAQGCIIGAMVGDASGATLEFLGRKPTSIEVENALKLVGGGVWNTAPGQITDDGELLLALLQALIGKNEYPSLDVAINYRRWYLSVPFDIGYTTDNALFDGDIENPNLADLILRNARRSNMDSKANGALMRISPLGVWSTRVDIDSAVAAARLDARLTHPNLSCQWSNAAYVVAIRHLMLSA